MYGLAIAGLSVFVIDDCEPEEPPMLATAAAAAMVTTRAPDTMTCRVRGHLPLCACMVALMFTFFSFLVGTGGWLSAYLSRRGAIVIRGSFRYSGASRELVPPPASGA